MPSSSQHAYNSHELDELFLAWAAGLFEGEGTITIAPIRRASSRGSHFFALHVSLTMTDEGLVRLLHRTFGGYIALRRGAAKRKDAYMWIVTSARAGEVLRLLQPFFRSTRVQEKAVLGLEFQSQKRRGAARYDVTYSQRQADFWQRMRVLNERGVNNRHVEVQFK